MAFGAITDTLGLADLNWELQGSTSTPEASSAQAITQVGDVACETQYEQTSTIEATYKSKVDTDITVDITPGEVINGYVITGLSIATSNTERPILTVQATKEGSETGVSSNVYEALTTTVNGKKLASTFSALTVTGELQSSPFTLSTQTARVTAADGSIAIDEAYQPRLEVTGEAVNCSAAAVIQAASGWTSTTGQNSSSSESNTGYQTASLTVYKNLETAP